MGRSCNFPPAACLLQIMHASRHRLLTLCLLTLGGANLPAAAAPVRPPAPGGRSLSVEPPSVWLQGPDAEQALLATLVDAPGQERDATRQARYTSENPAVARVTPEGRVRVVVN